MYLYIHMDIDTNIVHSIYIYIFLYIHIYTYVYTSSYLSLPPASPGTNLPLQMSFFPVLSPLGLPTCVTLTCREWDEHGADELIIWQHFFQHKKIWNLEAPFVFFRLICETGFCGWKQHILRLRVLPNNVFEGLSKLRWENSNPWLPGTLNNHL